MWVERQQRCTQFKGKLLESKVRDVSRGGGARESEVTLRAKQQRGRNKSLDGTETESLLNL